MESNIVEFKEKLEEDPSFREMFMVASNLDEVVDLAKENGYDLDVDEITKDLELTDYLLDAVAGGAKLPDSAVEQEI